MGAVIKSHVEVVGGLKSMIEFDKKRVINFFEDVGFSYSIFELFFAIKFLFIQYFLLQESFYEIRISKASKNKLRHLAASEET